MALRSGFTRYAFSIQYHGSSFLGFGYLKQQENAILPDGTDLRGYRSVEGRLRDAFGAMIGDGKYENIKVSSRTDRGVHALKNTCHVDIMERANGKLWEPEVLCRGLNYYLARQGAEVLESNRSRTAEAATNRYIFRRAKRKMDNWSFHCPMNELRILKVVQAPLMMRNKFKTIDNNQPDEVEWNVRFSASRRTYIYRILATGSKSNKDWALPFEWDRSWRLVPHKVPKKGVEISKWINDGYYGALDVEAMNESAHHLLGTHDFSSFRAVGCQRASPIVTINDIQVVSQPYGEPLFWEASGGLLGIGDKEKSAPLPQLVSVKVIGSAFVYHQVRNMVGALVAVGRGEMNSENMKKVLEAKDRTIAPAMAPAHGLFLVNVHHDDIDL